MMHDLYEMKDKRWVVVDTFHDLTEAIEYFGTDSVLQVSDGVYTVNAGDDISLLHMLILCKVA